MKEHNERQPRVCPHCGRFFTERPAISRKDNTTEICPECGIREALASICVQPDEAEQILDTIRRHSRSQGGEQK